MRRWLATSLAAVPLWLVATPARAAECPAAGKVIDAAGRPVPGVEVSRGSAIVSTDAEGRYAFDETEAPAAGTTVRLQLRHRVGNRVAFELYDDHTLVAWTRPDACAADFDARDPGTWQGELDPELVDDAFVLYAGFARAVALLDPLGLGPRLAADEGPALRIEAWQRTASPQTSFWVGTPSYHPSPPRDPLIGLGRDASRRDDPGAPDNREYHEYGHQALALGLGAAPHARTDTSHGGYFRNPTSADAWTEGFASFYAMMVADRIERRPEPNLLRVGGTLVDLELDYRPWELGGLEELAVAGLLLDMVDGPRPRPAESMPAVEGVDVVRSDAGAVAVVAFAALERTPPGAVGRLALTAGDADVWSIDVDPSAWRDPAPGRIAIALPGDVDAATIDGGRWLATERPDDDAVTVELPQLWETIATYRSTQPESNGRLFDVADLHAALRTRFGGKDADGDGLDDVDALFVAHGLFADADGDRVFDEGETIGSTAHPKITTEIGGESVTWPDRADRRRVPVPAGLRVSLTAPDVVSRWWVTLRDAEGYARVTRLFPDDADLATLVPPPAGEGANVTIVADADDHIAAIAATFDATELHDAALRDDAPQLEVTIALRRGEPAHATSPLDPRVLFWSGCGAAALGLVLLVVGTILGRGSRSSRALR